MSKRFSVRKRFDVERSIITNDPYWNEIHSVCMVLDVRMRDPRADRYTNVHKDVITGGLI